MDLKKKSINCKKKFKKLSGANAIEAYEEEMYSLEQMEKLLSIGSGFVVNITCLQQK